MPENAYTAAAQAMRMLSTLTDDKAVYDRTDTAQHCTAGQQAGIAVQLKACMSIPPSLLQWVA